MDPRPNDTRDVSLAEAQPEQAPSGLAPDLPPPAVQNTLGELLERIEELERHLINDQRQRLANVLDQVRDSLGELAGPLQRGLDGQRQELAVALHQLACSLESRLEAVAQAVQRLEEWAQQESQRAEEPPPPPADRAGDWERLLLADGLWDEPGLGGLRGEFLDAALSGQRDALVLAAQLFLVQAVPLERLPQVLKETGEAYYRWRPKTAGTEDPLERPLVAWVKRRCDAAGLRNTVEVVHPGDRFDAIRHNAAERGATVSAVNGWVVLRDNGKVYTKANVSVR
jgi:hypothetical protein